VEANHGLVALVSGYPFKTSFATDGISVGPLRCSGTNLVGDVPAYQITLTDESGNSVKTRVHTAKETTSGVDTIDFILPPWPYSTSDDGNTTTIISITEFGAHLPKRSDYVTDQFTYDKERWWGLSRTEGYRGGQLEHDAETVASIVIQGLFDPSVSYQVIFGSNIEAFINKIDSRGIWVTPPPHEASISGTEAQVTVTVKSGPLATSTVVAFDSEVAAATGLTNKFTYKNCPVEAEWNSDEKSCGGMKLGLSEEDPGKNCWDIKKADPRSKSGVYWINPDGAFISSFKVYCEQNMHGGVSVLLADSSKHLLACLFAWSCWHSFVVGMI
jgi:hypothetical protein